MGPENGFPLKFSCVKKIESVLHRHSLVKKTSFGPDANMEAKLAEFRAKKTNEQRHKVTIGRRLLGIFKNAVRNMLDHVFCPTGKIRGDWGRVVGNYTGT